MNTVYQLRRSTAVIGGACRYVHTKRIVFTKRYARINRRQSNVIRRHFAFAKHVFNSVLIHKVSHRLVSRRFDIRRNQCVSIHYLRARTICKRRVLQRNRLFKFLHLDREVRLFIVMNNVNRVVFRSQRFGDRFIIIQHQRIFVGRKLTRNTTAVICQYNQTFCIERFANCIFDLRICVDLHTLKLGCVIIISCNREVEFRFDITVDIQFVPTVVLGFTYIDCKGQRCITVCWNGYIRARSFAITFNAVSNVYVLRAVVM